MRILGGTQSLMYRLFTALADPNLHAGTKKGPKLIIEFNPYIYPVERKTYF
jgi:hypothetical protein